MDSTKVAIAAAFLAGTVAAMTGSALLREAPGAKTYYVHAFDVNQTPLPDGGNTIAATAFTDVMLALADGGTATVDLGGVPCRLGKLQLDELKDILIAATACAQNSP